MANRCMILVRMPLADIPDKTERQQYQALYKAREKWAEQGESEHFSDVYYQFLATQPGIPFEKNMYRGKELPAISADFKTINGEIWVQPSNSVGRPGLTYTKDKHLHINISTEWWFKNNFPWWAQIGFAGGKKYFGKYELNEDCHGYLSWDSKVSKILSNLKYAISVHETFNVNGEAWEWDDISKLTAELEKVYIFFNRIYAISKSAKATLDWSEVALYTMEYQAVVKNDEPNQIMANVKRVAKSNSQLKNGRITLEQFKKRYAAESSNYVPITKRDPFEGEFFPW